VIVLSERTSAQAERARYKSSEMLTNGVTPKMMFERTMMPDFYKERLLSVRASLYLGNAGRRHAGAAVLPRSRSRMFVAYLHIEDLEPTARI